MNLDDIMLVVDSETAGALCLSKGGWEGWLQCELWRHLTVTRNEVVEREIGYPGGRERCDLLASYEGTPLWVEIKAFGIFREGDADRFLDSIGLDVMKLDRKPAATRGISVVVVPKAIGDAFHNALRSRRWLGYERKDGTYAAVYHMAFS